MGGDLSSKVTAYVKRWFLFYSNLNNFGRQHWSHRFNQLVGPQFSSLGLLLYSRTLRRAPSEKPCFPSAVGVQIDVSKNSTHDKRKPQGFLFPLLDDGAITVKYLTSGCLMHACLLMPLFTVRLCPIIARGTDRLAQIRRGKGIFFLP